MSKSMTQSLALPASMVMTYSTIILVALNLRPSMAGIGPLLNRIQADIGISFTQASLLTMLPILAIGLASFVGIRLALRFGESRVMVLALGLIGAATALRAFSSGLYDLLLTALCAGVGIALIQSLMPVLIKSAIPDRLTFSMGVYVSALMGGAAISAATVPWLADHLGGWRIALALWALPSALALWGWQRSSDVLVLPPIKLDAEEKATPFYRLPRAWTLALFFGLGTAGYTCLLAWLPPFYLSLGWTANASGLLLSFMTAAEVVAGLLMPSLAKHSKDRRLVLAGVLLLSIIGFVGLWLAPLHFAWLWALIVGLGIGGLFPLSMIVTLDHHDDPRRAGGLLAFVQGIGYLLASVSPLIAGRLKEVFASFGPAWFTLTLVFVVMLVINLRFNPKTYPGLVD
ncbi:cyanate transporter [Chitinimonas sp. BJB300]|uniref:cyanate transporter n=1 Tax=Chitinimonas sp. BJB300 TaxID=1559339 RepID=UPI001E4AB508|nr:cyanate transporter [Chitinimonas sp. BJB300]